MIHAAQTLLLALSLTLTVGCCGPLWNHGGYAGACGGGCSDGCGACDGCGELYVDPWINDPADCCDPCDSCGNFNGQSCGKCRPVFAGIKSLWGYRCADSCGGGCDGGCDGGCSTGSCGGDCGCDGHGSLHPAGEYIGGYSEGQPTIALGDGERIVESHMSGQPTPARISQQSGTARQIFQPRRVNQPRSLAY
ncbi:hypothetical protein [Allorhodopirellula heiligendammensis]|uniref:Uncharacterized protein n=1 Tax=Allorhodopirellula heiligendammensis TaxID=2714739 RepID=A0A5C6BYS4_9BACT|nr:hypothetical protein [Allorhodopirellula heiligendammensis]TWU16611.1 hypothetical protein Poly21_38160 [Allorhodopirellula heiligendammensis]